MQVLTVATNTGQLFSYLAALPVVFDYHNTKVIYLTNLLELSILDVNKRTPGTKIDIETEPAFTGLGPNHAAVGMNNQVCKQCCGWPWTCKFPLYMRHSGQFRTHQ